MQIVVVVVVMGDGSSSSSSSSRRTARKKVTKKNTTMTLKAVMARYPELKDLSSEQRAVQYQAYVLHMNGSTSEELDKLKPVSFGWTTVDCCLDNDTSTGCEEVPDVDGIRGFSCYGHNIIIASGIIPNQCEFLASDSICCRSAPDSRVGSADWFWELCT